MNCQCCGLQKANIYKVESTLVVGNPLMLCNLCKTGGHEPRYMIVMAAKAGREVKPLVLGHKYCGNKLTADEVM